MVGAKGVRWPWSAGTVLAYARHGVEGLNGRPDHDLCWPAALVRLGFAKGQARSMGEALFQDIRYTFRQFRQSPGFAATAILTLSLGIGANTALFTILNALVLRELPIKDPAGLIGISGRNAPGQLRPSRSLRRRRSSWPSA